MNKREEPLSSGLSLWVMKKVFKDDARLGDFLEMYESIVEERGRIRGRNLVPALFAAVHHQVYGRFSAPGGGDVL